MLQLKNTSPFKASMALFPDAAGVDTLYVAVRATFTVRGGALQVAEVQEPLKLADEYWGEPGASSLKHAADLHLGKPATDIALLGDAWAPRGRPVPQRDVSLRIGPVTKTVRVFGERTWRGPLDLRISPPIPFERIPLVYEHAFGGVSKHDPEKGPLEIDWRNPVGIGFGMRKAPEDQAMRKLPNLEDPRQLITSPRDRPAPASFGFIAASWEPRRRYAGTYDDAWQETRAPYLPKDFQPRFFNAAHPDLVCPGHLRGGEPVHVEGASVDPLIFPLPACDLDVAVTIARDVARPPMKLQTVVLEPTPGRLAMVWLGAVGCDKRTLKVKLVEIAVKRLTLAGAPR
ncbi:DUF2169 family type VI secretion system accessory protein [Chondromyces apiculatus]|uniref:DUF2169 domain-containing protein n=1 Tax=Chondromyces apiculatus DSM 436 TaxID=1192034 RepID=A0A017T1Z0_9BACT|nr:DUF2169 domain-containing protein [Chondromyces apiculatus]EYF02870.1 Hypothetical protein CAP_6450 [Chondromyces apiculatus DSM 436]